MITAIPRTISRLCQGAFWTLAVTLVMASYSFVLQPAFDPPVEDIYTNDSVVELDPTREYIVKHKDGSYSIVVSTGDKFLIRKEVALLLISEGTTIIEEN